MSKQAQKFRELAEALTSTIEAKRNPCTALQRVTPRRATMIDQMAREADRIAKVQSKLLALADAHLAGSVPAPLAALKNRAQVEAVLSGYFHEEVRQRLAPVGIATREELDAAKAALEELGGTAPVTPPKQVLIAKMERDLLGTKIPGYFPTPAALVARMLDEAAIEAGMAVLEPSAGKGDIAQAIRAAGVEPKVIEVRSTLRDLLEAKDFALVGTDFIEFKSDAAFDRIVMNPPFERFQDVDHVRHAFSLLASGGRVVAIMGEAPFFRQDKKAAEFREWLDSVGGTSEKIEAGAFYASDRPTGVSTRLVVIDR